MAGKPGRSGGSGAAFEETIVRKRVPIPRSADERERERLKMAANQCLAEHEHMDASQFARAAFGLTEVDELWVERLFPNGDAFKVGKLTREIVTEHPNLDEHLLTAFGGPGKFLLKPAVRGFWVGPHKTVRLGAGNDNDAGLFAADAVSIDAVLAKTAKREGNIAAIRQMRDLNAPAKPEGGEDEVKVEQLTALCEVMVKMRGEGGSDAALREEVRELRASLAARPGAWDWLQPLFPILSPLLAGLPKSLISRVVLGLMPRAPDAPAPPVPPPFLDQVRGFLASPEIAAALGPLLQAAAAKVAGAPLHVLATPTAHTALPSSTEASMNFETTDPDVKEQIDYLILALGERRFADAYAVFQSTEVLAPFIAPVQPGVDPVPFWNRVKRIDPRLREMTAAGHDFIKHVQTQIERYLAAQVALGPPAQGEEV